MVTIRMLHHRDSAVEALLPNALALWRHVTMAITISNQQAAGSGPRPINLRRDTRQVFQLLDVSFGQMLDTESRRTLHDHISMLDTSPFAPAMRRPRGYLPGFVWEEEDRIVGNVSIMRSRTPHRYLVANVAVHPEFRRQGIARHLMRLAMNHITNLGGRIVMLQVRQENEAAHDLYRRLGFRVIGTMTQWSAEPRSLERNTFAPGETRIRKLRGQEWQDAYRLDQASVHPALNWPDPPPPDFYKGGFWRRLSDMFNGRVCEHWVTSDGRGQLTGLASITGQWGRPHELGIRVAPAYRGQLERSLLGKLLRRLPYLPNRTVRIEHPASDALMTQLLEEAHFRKRQTLTTMSFDLPAV